MVMLPENNNEIHTSGLIENVAKKREKKISPTEANKIDKKNPKNPKNKNPNQK